MMCEGVGMWSGMALMVVRGEERRMCLYGWGARV